MTTFWQDLRYGGRSLCRAPGFAAVAIATIAIGIGGTTSVFSVLHAVLLRPLPYVDPDRLVAIGHPNDTGRPGHLGFLTIRDWRERAHALEDVAAIRAWLATLTDGSEKVTVTFIAFAVGMANKSRNRVNQPPTGYGKKQPRSQGSPLKLGKRSVVAQAQRGHAELNLGDSDEEAAWRSGAPEHPRRPKAGR